MITYDVNTQTEAGKKRLNRVAKICVNYGQRVQYSIFECILDAAQLKEVTYRLETVMDKSQDSIRIYNLGNNYNNKIQHYGIKTSYDAQEAWIL